MSRTLVTLAALAAIAVVAVAKPTTKNEPAKADMTVKVLSVDGSAQKRNTAEAKSKWQALKVGDVLGEQWLVRTGLGSRVVMQMGDRNRVTLREATKMGISEFRKSGTDKVKTTLGLKYGSVQTDVDRSKGPSDFKLATPTVTMAIKGTNTTTSYNGDSGYGHQNNSGSSQSTNNGNGGTQGTQNGEGTDGQGTQHGDQTKQGAGTGSSSDPQGHGGNEQKSNNNNGGGTGPFGNESGGGTAPGLENVGTGGRGGDRLPDPEPRHGRD